MTKEEFKKLWEANNEGSGITFEDIANAAVRWGVCRTPRIRPMEQIRYLVLKSANTVDAEDFNPASIERE